MLCMPGGCLVNHILSSRVNLTGIIVTPVVSVEINNVEEFRLHTTQTQFSMRRFQIAIHIMSLTALSSSKSRAMAAVIGRVGSNNLVYLAMYSFSLFMEKVLD